MLHSPSPFLRLPTELRLKIYTSYFAHHPLYYPHLHHPFTPLLLTSHLIHTEATPLIPSSTHYIFPTTASLVTYLSSLPPTQLRLLRHITVTGHPFPLYHPSENRDSYSTFSFPSVLQLFAGLQLDCLTVWDAYHGPGVEEDGWGANTTYDELGEFIARGRGWRELVYRSRSDRWMGRVYDTVAGGWGGGEGDGKVEQPRGWGERLRERDGEGSGCAVEMWTFEAADPEARRGRARVDPGRAYVRREYREEEVEPELTFPEGTEFEVGRIAQFERSERIKAREAVGVEVRVRRSKGTDYVQDGVMENAYEQKLGEIFKLLSWKEIQEQDLFVRGAEDDPCAHL